MDTSAASSTFSPCNCLSLRQAARFVSTLYDRHLAQSDLSTSQFSILAFIHAYPGATMQQVGEQMVMERTSLVRAMKPLTRDGYVQQLPAPENARKLVFSLTAEGRRKYAEAHVHWSQAQAEFEASVGARRAAAMRDELSDLTNNPALAAALPR